MTSAANTSSNPSINIVNKRNSSGQNPSSHTLPNEDNGQV